MNLNSSTTDLERKLIDITSFTKAIERLRQESDTFRQKYVTEKPYPHLVIDNLFEPELLDRIVTEFPEKGDRDWLVWDTFHESKTTSRGIHGLSMFTQLFCLWLNCTEFIQEINKITGFDNLVGDPTFLGAGLHEADPGGWLDIHADYTSHLSLPLVRRVNLLIYLNRDWDENWGGELELWDCKDNSKRASYPPYFNRTIIFPTTDKTLHGAPSKLSCPQGISRKLISIYYWSPVPIPFFAKAGTPIIWESDRKNKIQWIRSLLTYYWQSTKQKNGKSTSD
jgi:Rps23 Pro-64 3,4-dihydroxylase Tpa1-like proline 4-hydroxylase